MCTQPAQPTQPTAAQESQSTDASITKLQVLVKSKSGVAIAMGSNKTPPGWEDMAAETAAREAAVHCQAQEPEAAEPKDDKEEAPEAPEAQVDVDNNVGPMPKGPRAAASSPNLRIGNQWPTKQAEDKIIEAPAAPPSMGEPAPSLPAQEAKDIKRDAAATADSRRAPVVGPQPA